MLPKFRNLGVPLKRLFSKSLSKIETDHQMLNRHRLSVGVHDFYPEMDDHKKIAPSCVLVGETHISENSFVGDFSVLKGDLNRVSLAEDSIVMENCLLTTVSELDKTGQSACVVVGPDSMMMPGSSVISAEFDRGVTIGPRSVVCEGARIGEYSMIGANSVVPPYRYIPAHQLWAGNPVRFVKDLSKQEVTSLRYFRKTFRHIKNLENEDMELTSSSFLEKEVLDDIEIDLKREDISVEDLEQALSLMHDNGLEIYFAEDLINHARQKLATLKSTELVS